MCAHARSGDTADATKNCFNVRLTLRFTLSASSTRPDALVRRVSWKLQSQKYYSSILSEQALSSHASSTNATVFFPMSVHKRLHKISDKAAAVVAPHAGAAVEEQIVVGEVKKMPTLSAVMGQFKVDNNLHPIRVEDVVLIGITREVTVAGVAKFVDSVKLGAEKEARSFRPFPHQSTFSPCTFCFVNRLN